MSPDHISCSPIKSPCSVVCCTSGGEWGGAEDLKWRCVMSKILQAYFPLQSKQSLHRDSNARGSDS